MGLRALGFGLLRISGLPFLIRETLQRRRLTILTLHDAEPEALRHLIRTVRRSYNFIPLRDYIEARESDRLDGLPPRPVALVIDDGLKSSRALLDVFREHGITPTLFICSGIAGTNRRFWWTVPEGSDEVERLKRMPDAERVRALESLGYEDAGTFPDRSALSRDEIDEMRDVFDFQAHTVSHPILTRCTAERAWLEIAEGKRMLEDDFGFDVYAFAYPNGDYSDREVAYVAKAGYRCAVTSDAGFNGAETDLLRLRRVGIDKASGVNEVIGRACGLPAYAKQLLLGTGSRRPYPASVPGGSAATGERGTA